MRYLSKLLVVTVLAATGASAVAVPNAAIEFTDSSWTQGGPYTVGFEFTPNVNIVVTHLGFYDQRDTNVPGSNGPGLPANETYPVAIYDTVTAAPVFGATATVTNASPLVLGDPSNGYFYYQPLANPVTLLAGHAYRTAAYTGEGGLGGYAYAGLTGFNDNPAITVGNGYYAGAFANNPTLFYPTNVNPSGGGIAYGTPNFLILVPEPASLALLGAGVTFLVARRRRA